MKAVFGRFLWAVVTALWPAVTAVREEFHVHWLSWGLTWALALAEAGCALALRARGRAREREREQAREADAEHRIGELEARVAAYEQGLALAVRYGNGGAFPAGRAAGGRECPEPGAARLRLVRPQGKRA